MLKLITLLFICFCSSLDAIQSNVDKFEYSSEENSKIHLFIHACTLANWEEILQRQFNLIVSSGLYEACQSISMGVLGNGDIRSFIKKYPKLTILFQNPDVSLYEKPTLLALYQFAITQSNASIMYIHTKGITKTGNSNVTDWVKYMEYFIIERWQNCVEALKKNDVCGVNWHLVPKPHFSGNFWWANSNYISTLPDHINTQALTGVHANLSDYLAPEMWIGQNSPRVKCFHQSRCAHYQDPYPEANYKTQNKKISKFEK